MKRFLMILALMGIVCVAMAQTRPMVTLDHNGQLTFFDKVSCLQDAIEASEDGDVLYLSPGLFGANSSSSRLTINKHLSFVGCGYDSHIIADLLIREENQNAPYMMPLFDGVRLESVEFTFSSKKAENIEIKKSKIAKLNISGIYTSTIDRCYIEEYLNSSSENVSIYNSKINKFDGCWSEILINCNISKLGENYERYPSYASSCIIAEGGYHSGVCNYGIFENCVIPLEMDAKDIRNCYRCSSGFLDANLDSTIDLVSSGYLGIDGTEVGVYGGEWFPYSTSPSVPTVDSAKSSIEYDAGNNQLKVNVTVISE